MGTKVIAQASRVLYTDIYHFVEGGWVFLLSSSLAESATTTFVLCILSLVLPIARSSVFQHQNIQTSLAGLHSLALVVPIHPVHNTTCQGSAQSRQDVLYSRMSCPNGASPLLLPWTNVTVSDDGKAVSRGIEIGVGTPVQVMSLRPAIVSNNLFLFNVAECGSAANSTCLGNHGGVYDPTKSSTYEPSTKAQWNGTLGRDTDAGSYIYLNDDLSYGTTGRETEFPLFMNQPGYGERNI